MSEISLSQANTIIESCFAKGAQMGLKPLTIVVLDTGGHVRAAARQDGASPGRFSIAQGKAYAAVMTGMTGTALMQRAEQQAYFVNALSGVFDGKVVPVPGGILVKDSDGVIMGAVGVTGDTSDNDAQAGLAGIEGAGLNGDA